MTFLQVVSVFLALCAVVVFLAFGIAWFVQVVAEWRASR